MQPNIYTHFLLSGCLLFTAFHAANAQDKTSLFKQLSASETGIHFQNKLTEDSTHNVLAYEYFYNGGGVAVGDVNGDGLPDIYFTGNMVENKLYLNTGHLHFKDITKEAGVRGKKDGWKTGVTMADVNGDGLLDIYVCYSGNGDTTSRENQLFINEGNDKNGVPHFKEMAAQYGLADQGYSTQAIFFDMDNDGDLDCFVINHNIKTFKELEMNAVRKTRDPYAGNHLYENVNNHFTDITTPAGIVSNPIGFGLGIAAADINQDGWEDLYVSDDYDEKDFLYINNHDHTFTDRITQYLRHISHFSMGSDIADYNNDGLPDIFTLDMLPDDNKRQKLLYGPENYARHNDMVSNGYYQQFMRNMLQLNNGDNTFSEVGQLAGMSNTDWSWCPLVADFDNDGWKDLYITNGYMRDYTNMDFMKYKSNYTFDRMLDKKPVDLFYLVKQMPSTLVHNYVFRNNHDLTFTNESEAWGMSKPVISSGAAYADLDNDGDLDLIVNNTNGTASIYQNETSETTHAHYLHIKLDGARKNRFGLGAKIYVYTPHNIQYFEQMPTRGFQSSVSEIINVGLAKNDHADSIKIIWLGNHAQTIQNIAAGQTITLHEKDADNIYQYPDKASSHTIFAQTNPPINYQHKEYPYNDFKRQPMMPQMLSDCGPVMAKWDVNGDGREDIFIGGSKTYPGSLFIQNAGGSFTKADQNVFNENAYSTDAAAIFFDADGDGDLDLYVASGGYEDYQSNDPVLQDRLYLNDGKGNFTKATNALPSMLTSKSCVRVADFNGDGYPDLFVGGRVIPGQYPLPPPSYLLLNDGHGHFTDVTDSVAPGLRHIGMVTDAVWMDLNGDKKPDLILAGEFMPVTVLINGKTFEDKTLDYFDEKYYGFWDKMLTGDFNNDGHAGLIIGNLGTNSQMKASDQQPVTMTYKDFDNNGSIDPILCYYIDGKSYPFASRDEMLDQMYFLKKRFTSYASYSTATINDIFKPKELEGAVTLKATRLQTTYFEFENGRFKIKPLPEEAQFAPVCSILGLDYNGDGNEDFLLLGNQSKVKLKLGRYDANYGELFKGDGKGNFTYVPQTISGLHIIGDARSAVILNKNNLLVGINNEPVQCYQLTK